MGGPLGNDPAHNYAIVNPKFRVVAATKFAPDDYNDFMTAGDEWDMTLMKPIIVHPE